MKIWKRGTLEYYICRVHTFMYLVARLDDNSSYVYMIGLQTPTIFRSRKDAQYFIEEHLEAKRIE